MTIHQGFGSELERTEAGLPGLDPDCGRSSDNGLDGIKLLETLQQ